MFRVCWCFAFFNIVFTSAEVISLIHESKLTCVLTKESQTLPVYLSPPLYNLSKENRKDILLKKWTLDVSQNFEPLIDKRWGDFLVRNFTQQKLYEVVPTVISVCVNNTYVDILLTDETYGNKKTIRYNLTRTGKNYNGIDCTWHHLSLYTEGNYVKIINFQNEESKYQINFVPGTISVYVPVKVHWYKHQVAVALSTQWDITSIKFENTLCLQMYVSVDEKNALEIAIEQDSDIVDKITIEGFNKQHVLKSWKLVKLHAAHEGKANLLLSKMKERTATGYWAVSHIEFCDHKFDIYTASLQSANSSAKFKCEVLGKSFKSSNTLCNQTGFIDNNCSISCEEILGISYPNCEGHKICIDDNKCRYVSSHEEKISSYLQKHLKRLQNLSYYLKKNTELTLEFKCLSKWCKNNMTTIANVSLDNNIIETILEAITTYQVVAKSDDLNATFNYTTPPKQPEPVQELTVYSRNKTDLWIRWFPSYPPTGEVQEYLIEYKPLSDQSSFKLTVNATAFCDIWRSFICANLKNLKNNTMYSVAVQTRNSNVDDLSLPAVITAITQQAPSKPPEILDFQFVHDNFYITWLYPNISNGPIKYFNITTKCLQQRETVFIEAVDQVATYNATIGSCFTFFIVSVKGINEYEGEESNIEVTILRPDYDLKFRFVQYCLVQCALLFPKTSLNFYVMQEHKNIFTNLTMENLEFNYKLNLFNYFPVTDTFYKLHLFIEKRQFIIRVQPFRKEVALVALVTKTVLASDIYVLLSNIAIVLVIISVLALFAIVILYLIVYWKKSRHMGFLGGEETALLTRKSTQYRNLKHNIKEIINGTGIVLKQYEELNLQNNNNEGSEDQPNRVFLKGMKNISSNNMINAHYIKGLNKPTAYIITHPPKFNTVRDFWLLIWQENVETIVMGSNFMENEQRKCVEYFPQQVGATYDCGMMEIKLTYEKKFDTYIERILQVCYESDYARQVQHFQLIWNPDNCSPLFSNKVAPLAKVIQQISQISVTPIVFHCSPTLNRSSLLILCDLALHLNANEENINFFMLTKQMRQQHENMITSETLYALAFFVVYECLLEKEDLWNEEKYYKEIKRLNLLCKIDDYILKRFVSRQKNVNLQKSLKFFTMKQPIRETLDDLWVKVVEREVEIIVFLNQSDVLIFWPHIIEIANLVIKVDRFKHFEDVIFPSCSTYKLEITCRKDLNEEIYKKRILLCELNSWSSDDLQKWDELSQFITELIQFENRAKKVLITCSDGVTNSSLFVILLLMMEKKSLLFRDVVREAKKINSKLLINKKLLEHLFQYVHFLQQKNVSRFVRPRADES